MRAAYLEDARQDLVSQSVREVLHRRGALVYDHSGGRVKFKRFWPGGKWTWERGGYVGVFQHMGEKEVEVRLQLRARWPYRIVWFVAFVNVLAAIVTFATNPPGTTYFAVAAVAAFALLIAGLLYMNTLRPVRREEQQLLEDFEAEFARGFEGVETEQEREVRELEEAIEAELERRRIRAERDAEPRSARKLALPKPSFRLRRATPPTEDKADEAQAEEAAPESKRRFAMPSLKLPRRKTPAEEPPAEETLEEKRARLLARKAELEREASESDE